MEIMNLNFAVVLICLVVAIIAIKILKDLKLVFDKTSFLMVMAFVALVSAFWAVHFEISPTTLMWVIVGSVLVYVIILLIKFYLKFKRTFFGY